MAKTQDGDTPSMEEILQTIRGVISGDKDETDNTGAGEDNDVLDLTEMVEEDGSVTSIAPTANENTPQSDTADKPADEEQSKDVLQDIESALQPADAGIPDLEEENEADEKATEVTPAENQAEENDEMLLPDDVEEEPSEDEMLLPDDAEEEPSDEDDDEMLLCADPEEETPSPPEELSTSEEEPDTASSVIENDEPSSASPKKTSRLISEQTASASTKAFESLLQSVPKTQVDGPSFRTGVTLEDLVIEAMKPELSAWLDKNLPTLVTQLVEKEIKKLLPGPDDD